MVAGEIFKTIKVAMNQAKEEQSLGLFRECCSTLGIQETDDGSLVGLRYSYKFTLPDGTIHGSLRSYDQSGPFQNLPDMNKIEMILKCGDDVVDRYYVEWED